MIKTGGYWPPFFMGTLVPAVRFNLLPPASKPLQQKDLRYHPAAIGHFFFIQQDGIS